METNQIANRTRPTMGQPNTTVRFMIVQSFVVCGTHRRRRYGGYGAVRFGVS